MEEVEWLAGGVERVAVDDRVVGGGEALVDVAGGELLVVGGVLVGYTGVDGA
jgi:hypothetical protein